jgi:hypothetical protein
MLLDEVLSKQAKASIPDRALSYQELRLPLAEEGGDMGLAYPTTVAGRGGAMLPRPLTLMPTTFALRMWGHRTLSWTQSRLTGPLQHIAKADEGSRPLVQRISRADISDARTEKGNQSTVRATHAWTAIVTSVPHGTELRSPAVCLAAIYTAARRSKTSHTVTRT